MQYPLHDTLGEAESAARLTLQESELSGIEYIVIYSCEVDPITGAPIHLIEVETIGR